MNKGLTSFSNHIHYSPFTLLCMNYIKHLNAFFSIIRNDRSLNANHISLYLALFQYWNYNRFQNPYPVYRDNIMQLSKIGSRNTYHKCMKELHQLRYIIYHPAPSKFLPVKITMTRLDTYFEKLQPHQLDIFSPGTDNDTQQDSDLTSTSPKIDTHTVPKWGQNIKPNISKQRETPTPTYNQQKIIIMKENPGASNIPSSEQPSATKVGNEVRGVGIPHQQDVKEYFRQNNYPVTEATKFYNHYKSLGWKIQGKAPIEDWKPLVEKWMTNAKNWVSTTEPKSVGPPSYEKEIQYLYQSWKEGKNIMHQLSENHFHHLQLQLTPEIMALARSERIKQLSSSNHHSHLQLLMAYTSDQPNKDLLSKDQPNIELIAKRIAIIYHFINTQQNEH